MKLSQLTEAKDKAREWVATIDKRKAARNVLVGAGLVAGNLGAVAYLESLSQRVANVEARSVITDMVADSDAYINCRAVLTVASPMTTEAQDDEVCTNYVITRRQQVIDGLGR